MNLSIIIPNYNGEKLLSKNLPKVLAAVKDYKKGVVEIIIPDDPSNDNSQLVIEKFINSIRDKNIIGRTVVNKDAKKAGFSKNVNRGVAIATGEILILFNSDVAPGTNFLQNLIEYFDDPELFAVGFMDESIEGGQKVLRGRGLGEFKRGFLMHRAGKTDKDNTLWVSGGSSAFRRSIWDNLKGFDPIYDPFYWEDIDLSYRALKSGYKIKFAPEIVVVHEHEEGVVKTEFKDEYVKKIAYRNQFIFVWKNITDSSMLISHILWLPYHLIKTLTSGDTNFCKAFLLALTDFSKISQSRKLVRKHFTKSDSDIISKYRYD